MKAKGCFGKEQKAKKKIDELFSVLFPTFIRKESNTELWMEWKEERRTW